MTTKEIEKWCKARRDVVLTISYWWDEWTKVWFWRAEAGTPSQSTWVGLGISPEDAATTACQQWDRYSRPAGHPTRATDD